MGRRAAILAVVTIAALAAVWGVFRAAPRWYGTPREVPAATAAPAAVPERKIKATLFYVAADGLTLASAEGEVPFAEPVAAQAARIVEAQLRAARPPLSPAVPAGTTLRSLFITERGEAFVDLSPEVSSRHPGGVLEEIFTVYAIVNALTVNLPSILRVQILVNGREVDTLAGHLDLRRPLQKNLRWLAVPAAPAPEAPAPPAQ